MKRLSGSALAFALWVLPAAAAVAAERPNFLFIITDDQRWDTLGCVQQEQGERGRYPWFQTPNLDRLAAEGVRFRNAFVTSSLCAPSRAAFLTGRYNHCNGIANNHTSFDEASLTWASELRKAGYTRAFIGKWHMGLQRGQRPGFDYSASFIGHASYHDASFEINGIETPTTGWVDDVSTDYAIEFLNRKPDRPWAMAVCFKTPHGSFEPPARWADKFPDGFARPVPNLTVSPPFPFRLAPLPEAGAEKLKANLNYFRCLGAMDENVGRLLEALDQRNLAQNTMVVFSSDNGFYFSEHRLGDKRSAYEESLRVPLLLRYPKLGVRNQVLDPLVLNIDLAPTWLDFAGVPVPKDVQGRSWRPLLEGAATEWRKAFFYEYFWEPQRGNPTPSMTAVRTETAKLIRYKDHDEWTELFDLARDPYETRNLWNVPSAARLQSELEAEYDRQKQAVGYVWPDYADAPEQFLPARPLNAVVLEYRFDEDTADKVIDDSGKGNQGVATSAPLVDGRSGKKARRFDGRGHIDIRKAPSLNPGVRAWTMEVTFQADAPDGVLVAHGGDSNGYCLALCDGKPQFTLVADRELTRLAAKEKVVGQWTTLRASYDTETASLFVNGQPAGQVQLKADLRREPHDTLQIGADLGSQVLATPLPKFQGLMESVRIVSGQE